MRALVTGGTKGIGLATVGRLIEEGYLVTALYHRDEAAAEAAKKWYPAAEFLRADVANAGEMQAVFARFPSLDALVLNAGVPLFGQVQDISFETYRSVMDTNFGGVFLGAKYGIPKMLEKGGAIVAVSSVWGETGGSCESIYSATKGAVQSFIKALAKELAPAMITANCVSPGVVETEMNAHLSAGERAALEEEIPLGRYARPEEVAEAIVFLIESRYITGQILPVNGGFHI